MKKSIFLILILLICQIGASELFAEETTPEIKKQEIYAVIKAYYGYHHSEPENSDSETDLSYRLQSNTRFGGKLEIENIKAHVELGLMSPLYLRLAYGTVSFNGLNLTAGQNYTPYDWTAHGDVVDDNNFLGFGASYDGRLPQIKAEYNGFYIALITPSRLTTGITGSGTSSAVNDTSVLAPKTAIGYDYVSGSNIIGLGGAVNIIKINDDGCTADDETITSWIGYIHLDASTDRFGLRGNFAYGQNTGNFGIMNVSDANPDTMSGSGSFSSFKTSSSAVNDNGRIKNTTSIEGYINPYIIISRSLSLNAGFGYVRVTNDTYRHHDDQASGFAGFKYSFNNHIAVLPEFVYRDFLKDRDGNDQGNEFYAGTQFQVSL